MAYANNPYPGNFNMNSPPPPIPGPVSPEARRNLSTAQPMVSSASSLPRASSAEPNDSNQHIRALTPAQMFQQTHQFYQKIGRLHEEERKTWHIEREGWQKERKELVERIDQLESYVFRLIRNDFSSTTDVEIQTDATNRLNDNPLPGTLNQENQDPISRAVWQGSESRTTRTFSDSVLSEVPRQPHHLNSIAEHPEHGEHKKSVGFVITPSPGIMKHTSLAGVPGELIHPDYSGITLKSTAFRSESSRAAEVAVVESSPIRSPSPLTVTGSPQPAPQPVIRPRLLDIPTANMNSEDLYSADAGHTPLTRVTGIEDTSGGLTPIKTEVEHSPLESHSSRPAIRQPNERHDSYFQNALTDGTIDEIDQDPALQEPLGVSAENTSSDASFLDQVNKALAREESKQSDSTEESSSNQRSTERTHNRGLSEADDFPKLRMKASFNFGAPFGESNHQ